MVGELWCHVTAIVMYLDLNVCQLLNPHQLPPGALHQPGAHDPPAHQTSSLTRGLRQHGQRGNGLAWRGTAACAAAAANSSLHRAFGKHHRPPAHLNSRAQWCPETHSQCSLRLACPSPALLISDQETCSAHRSVRHLQIQCGKEKKTQVFIESVNPAISTENAESQTGIHLKII